jgi:hypothetical protein
MPRKFDFISPGIELTEIDNSVLPPARDNDGPIIIGRTRKGPALKPVKIRSLDDYLAVFGAPNAGGSSPSGDLWRDGAGASAPTYASYAAQAWLAGGTAPVTMVRLLGEDHTQATGEQRAGWQLPNTKTSSNATNSTAYGLFIVDKADPALGGGSGQITIAAGVANGDNFSIGSVEFQFQGSATLTETATLKEVVDTSGQNTNMAALIAKIEDAIAAGELSDITVEYNSGTNTAKFYKTSGGAVLITSTQLGAGLQINDSTIEAFDSTKTIKTGALAAIFYASTGSLGLVGGWAGDSGTIKPNSSTLVESSADDIQFKLIVKGADGVTVETATPFNFNRNSGNYIRKVFNTNPTLINSRTTAAGDLKTYWLGETFERHLKTNVTSTTSGNQYGVLLPLEAGSVNWSDRREGYAAASSGWVISNYDGDAADYDIVKQPKMFRLVALQEGEEIQKNVFISIENLNLPPNPEVYAYSTFDVVVRNMSGTSLERFSNLVMDENSPNFIARQIGDMYQTWDESQKRWKMYGDYPNQSDYIRAVMPTSLPSKESALPFGFLGPGAPKGFGILSADSNPKSFNLGSDFTGAFVENGDPLDPGGHASDFISHSLANYAVKFTWPKIQLRKSGTEGGAANPYQAMYGIRPKISTSSRLHDNDYCDYLRGLPESLRSNVISPTGDYEHSITFSLDELKINEVNATVDYEEGSLKGDTSYRSSGNTTPNTNGSVEDLLNLGVSKWAMPLFGGFDGLDITEVEPFNNDLMNPTDTDLSNHLANSFSLAAGSVADAEVVPANLILAPGIYKPHLTDKLISTADSRQDMLAIIDLEGDYKPKAEADNTDDDASRRGTVKNTVSKLKIRNIDSSFACAFYPWVQITDRLGGSELVWIPSSIAALGAMSRSDSLADVWFAPAGFNRGGLGSLGGPAGPTVVQARQRLDVKDRDDLYAVGINPIASFPNEGLVVFGQKTLQQRSSALDRINVRRLMLYLKKEIGEVAKNTLFQNNVPATWADFKGRAEPILSDVQNRFGLTDYRLILDETTTTPDLIDRNIMYAKVFLKPARAIEFIAIDFMISKTGAEFA